VSKESKPRDLWRQLDAAGHDRPTDFCRGCGYYLAVNGQRRGDCTAVNKAKDKDSN
jgi:hypothetical protein